MHGLYFNTGNKYANYVRRMNSMRYRDEKDNIWLVLSLFSHTSILAMALCI